MSSHKRSKLIPSDNEFYDKTMCGGGSEVQDKPKKPFRVTQTGKVVLVCSALFSLTVIYALFPSINTDAVKRRASAMSGNATVESSGLEQEVDTSLLATAIAESIFGMIYGSDNAHVVIAAFEDGSTERTAIPPFEALMEASGGSIQVIKREIRGMIMEGILAGAVSFDLRAVSPIPLFRQAGKTA